MRGAAGDSRPYRDPHAKRSPTKKVWDALGSAFKGFHESLLDDQISNTFEEACGILRPADQAKSHDFVEQTSFGSVPPLRLFS